MAGSILIKGLKSGYDGIENALRTNADQKFGIWFDAPARIEGLRAASIRAAKELRGQTDKEIVVLYSGGADSEWVLESFAAAGIPVTPLVVEYTGGANENDMYWARRYLGRRQYQNTIWDRMNLRDWYDGGQILEIAERVQTPELAYTAQFGAMIRHASPNRIFITGYDEPQITADDSGDKREWTLTYMERHYSVAKFFSQYEINGVSWGGYSPELFASYVLHPQWQMLVANMYNPMVWNSESVKPHMLQYSFPFMETRPKYTGFESSLDFVIGKAQDWQKYALATWGYNWTSSWSQDIKETWRLLGVKI